MVNILFGKRADPVVIDIQEIFERFDLNNNRYKEHPLAHIMVMGNFVALTLRGGNLYGKGKVFFTDPAHEHICKAPEKQFLDEPEPEDEHIPLSAAIAFTEQPFPGTKRSFHMMIRTALKGDDEKSRKEALVFGLGGMYSADGEFTVQKLLVPGMDSANRMTTVQPVSINKDNVRGALYFAELCAKALVDGDKPFHPRVYFQQSLGADLDETGVRILRSPPGPA